MYLKTLSRMICLLTFAGFVAGTSAANASKPTVPSTPRLNAITPRGVQVGTDATLIFSGARLKNAEEIFFYDKGVSVTKIESINNNQLKVTVKIAPDCRIGEHVAQVRTKNGISDYRSFFVGRLPNVAEVEPNTEFSKAQPIKINSTVTGRITNEDVDYFKVSGKKGDRLSVEIQALRLGFMFDPAIALLDKNRFELAASDDTPLMKQDSFLSVVLPEDGEYVVMVRESSFGGSAQSRYRLHVGNFPRPAAVYPAGGKRNTELDLQFIDTFVAGKPVHAVGKKIKLPNEYGFRDGLFFTDDLGTTPSPMPFRLSDFDNYLEKEPNNNFDNLPAQTLPIALNGVIESPNDFDYFKVTAKKGQVWHVECFARRIGSGLDPVINIFDAKRKHIVGNDDAKRPDAYIRFRAPADGDYYVRVMDHLRRGQPDFVYRVEISTPQPKLAVSIKRIDRYSQQRQNIAVPQGGRFAVLLDAAKQDFAGTIQLMADNLPHGVKMTAPPMHRNLNTMPVVFEVAENAPLAGSLIEFKAKSQINEKQSVTGKFGNLADFALGQPNNALYYGCKVDQLAVAVVEKLPFKLELVQPKAPLVQGGKKKIKIIAHRDKGFDAAINLQFPFRSPGVGTTYQITMPKGKSEIEYPLNANSKAMIGKWPMYVIGVSSFKGPAWTATQMGELEIGKPWVTGSIPRMSIKRGESTQLICKLNHLQPFEGEATAQIFGTPANIIVEPAKKFTKDTKEIVFNVTTNAKSPYGRHRGLFCQISVPHNGEMIISRLATAELRINKPRPPKKKKVAKKAPAKPKKPAAKPVKTPPKPVVVAKPKPSPAAKPAPSKTPTAKK